MIHIPDDYTFYLRSNDGSKLFVNGVLLVNNDGCHDTMVEVSAVTDLSAGLHGFRVEFFQRSGPAGLQFMYKRAQSNKPAQLVSGASKPPMVVYQHHAIQPGGALTQHMHSVAIEGCAVKNFDVSAAAELQASMELLLPTLMLNNTDLAAQQLEPSREYFSRFVSELLIPKYGNAQYLSNEWLLS